MRKILPILLFISFGCSAQTIHLSVHRTVKLRNVLSLPTKIAYFGDSFTAPNGLTYPTGVSNDYPAIPKTNYAIGGTRVCYLSYAPAGNNDLIDKYQTELDSGYRGGMVSFMYGTNDESVGGLVNATWKETYKSIIKKFIDAGWPKNRLLIMAIPCATIGGKPLSRQYSAEIAKELGIMFYDVYKRFIDTGVNSTLFLEGDTHPNAAGQAVIAAGYETFLLR